MAAIHLGGGRLTRAPRIYKVPRAPKVASPSSDLSNYRSLDKGVAYANPWQAPKVAPSVDPFFGAPATKLPSSWLQTQRQSASRINATLKKPKIQKFKAPKQQRFSPTTVARKLAKPAAPAAPAPKPVDPLEALRGEYDKYLQDMYAGLNVTLKGDQAQYAKRSADLAARLKATYGEADTTAANAVAATQNDILDYAKRLGLQQAAPAALSDWAANNERIKAQNAAAQAQTMATNDMIRTNYYDFLGDKVSSAASAGVAARANLNDIIAQAILQRQQAAQAAAQAAAARASSRRGGGGRSRRRGGGGGGGSSYGNLYGLGGTATSTEAFKNAALNDLAQNNPYVRNAMMANDPIGAAIIAQGTRWHVYNPAKYNTVFQPNPAATHYKTVDPAATAAAYAYLQAAGKTGGVIRSGSQVIKGKYKP